MTLRVITYFNFLRFIGFGRGICDKDGIGVGCFWSVLGGQGENWLGLESRGRKAFFCATWVLVLKQGVF